MLPLEINEFSESALSIIWQDDHHSIYLFEDLRNACPCAKCNEIRKSRLNEVPLKKTISISISSSNIKPAKIETVGNYAVRFYWSDRHSTGIYTYKFLREICPCDECTGNVPA